MTTIRDCSREDLDTVRMLNDAAVPAMNELTVDELAWFLAQASFFRVADTGDGLAAFMIGLNEGLDYDSPNYRWFQERFSAFAYIDRIAVSHAARRQGLAARFYRDFEQRCAQTSGRMVCEVNLRPANEGSMRFHERQGFVTIGTQETDGGAKQVALMLKELNANE